MPTTTHLESTIWCTVSDLKPVFQAKLTEKRGRKQRWSPNRQPVHSTTITLLLGPTMSLPLDFRWDLCNAEPCQPLQSIRSSWAHLGPAQLMLPDFSPPRDEPPPAVTDSSPCALLSIRWRFPFAPSFLPILVSNKSDIPSTSSHYPKQELCTETCHPTLPDPNLHPILSWHSRAELLWCSVSKAPSASSSPHSTKAVSKGLQITSSKLHLCACNDVQALTHLSFY